MDMPEGENLETEPGQDLPPDPVVPERKGPGRPKGSRNKPKPAAGSGSTDRAPGRRQVTKVATKSAGDLYALLGTGAHLAGFPMAGFAMQAQAPQAGRIIANHALANWPRFYSFLERAGKASGIVPLVLIPIAAETFVRSTNPAAVTLSMGILQQLGADLAVDVPNPETGEVMRMGFLDALGMARQGAMQQRAADAYEANGAGQPEDVPQPPESEPAEPAPPRSSPTGFDRSSGETPL